MQKFDENLRQQQAS